MLLLGFSNGSLVANKWLLNAWLINRELYQQSTFANSTGTTYINPGWWAPARIWGTWPLWPQSLLLWRAVAKLSIPGIGKCACPQVVVAPTEETSTWLGGVIPHFWLIQSRDALHAMLLSRRKCYAQPEAINYWQKPSSSRSLALPGGHCWTQNSELAGGRDSKFQNATHDFCSKSSVLVESTSAFLPSLLWASPGPWYLWMPRPFRCSWGAGGSISSSRTLVILLQPDLFNSNLHGTEMRRNVIRSFHQWLMVSYCLIFRVGKSVRCGVLRVPSP